MPTETLREHRLGHTGGLSFTAARCVWHGRVSRNIRGARESGRPAGREPGLSLSCFPPLPPRVAEDAREGARPSWDSSRPWARPPSLPPSLRRSFSAPPLPAPSPAGSGRWAAAAAASGRAAEDAPPAPPSLRPRSRAGRGCRGARVPGPASQAMGEGGAVGRRRPFPGAPRRRWWRRQQQQQRQRQRWWPGRGGEGEGRAAMGLAGLQVGVAGPAARGAGGARGPAGPGGGRATRAPARPGPAGRPTAAGPSEHGCGGRRRRGARPGRPRSPPRRALSAPSPASPGSPSPGRKMSKPRAVEVAAAAAAVAATAPGPEMVERRGPGRPRTNGVSRHPSRTRSARPQEPCGRAPPRAQLREHVGAPAALGRGCGRGARQGSFLFCCLPGSGVPTRSAMTLASSDLGKVCVFMAFPHPETRPSRWRLRLPRVCGACPGPTGRSQVFADLVNGSPGRKASSSVSGKALLLSVLTRRRGPTPRDTSGDLYRPTGLPTAVE